MTIGPLFDAHLHIIDPGFPLVPNQGFLPDAFTVDDYLDRVAGLDVRGGAVVSGSFQAFDQGWLVAALQRLGPAFVGVTQLPADTGTGEIRRLDGLGVRALRFNLHRGVHPDLGEMDRLARLARDTAGWHIELYLDAAGIPPLAGWLEGLLASGVGLCVDHLGLSRAGLPGLLRLVERGARVKATGFGRLDFPPASALRAVAAADPQALLFGTDLPGTRAPRAFAPADIALLADALGDDAPVRKALYDNAVRLYRPAVAP